MPKMFANLNNGTATNAGQETVDINVVGGDFTGGASSVAWADITGKPAVIASGADQATARTSIGAGTSSVALGATAGAALASAGAAGSAATSAHSDHVHPFPTAANVGAAATVHTHTVSQVTDLTAAKLMTGAVAAVNDVAVPFTDLSTAAAAYNTLLAALRTRGIISGS